MNLLTTRLVSRDIFISRVIKNLLNSSQDSYDRTVLEAKSTDTPEFIF